MSRLTGDVAGATSVSGRQLQAMLEYAAEWLRRNATVINALNVFPVPDGDTGSNMTATVDAAVLAAGRAPNHAGAVLRAAADGALLGARGNSGVILSQVLSGLATTVRAEERLDGSLLAAGLAAASRAAAEAVSDPKPGTMLTVLADVAAAANESAGSGGAVTEVLLKTVAAAKESVARTPSLLPILREAGVVDSGGLGVATILEGCLFFAQGVPLPAAAEVVQAGAGSGGAGILPARRRPPLAPPEPAAGYGYCTEFVVEGGGLRPDDLRSELQRIGESVLVVGTADLLRIHVHTADPGAALSAGVRRGALSRVKVDNIHKQHQALLAGETPALPETALPRARRAGETPVPPEREAVCVVAVTAGDGFERLYRDYGALVVAGGQGANPSTAEILSAVERAGCATVLVLPNNGNVRAAAEQAARMSQWPARVLPTTSEAQGIAAMLAFNGERGAEANEAAMKSAAARVHTVEITRASRDVAMIGGRGEVRATAGEPVAILDGSMAAAGQTEEEALLAALNQLASVDAITIFFGRDVPDGAAELLGERVGSHWPDAQIEVVRGGQPIYDYIVSIE